MINVDTHSAEILIKTGKYFTKHSTYINLHKQLQLHTCSFVLRHTDYTHTTTCQSVREIYIHIYTYTYIHTHIYMDME